MSEFMLADRPLKSRFLLVKRQLSQLRENLPRLLA